MQTKQKLVRITTIPIALEKLLSGQLRFMDQYYEVIGIAAEPENLERVKNKEGIRVHSIDMTRKITPFKDLAAVWHLYRFLRKEKPLFVHTHTPKAGLVGMLASKLAGVPNRMHTIAGLPLLEKTGTTRKILDLVEKLTCACATNVYPNSFVMADIMVQNGYCPKRKIKVLGNGSSNGINTGHFSNAHFSEAENRNLRQSLGVADGDFVFVFVGRIVRDKGIEELVWAFKKLASEHKNAKLLLVGDYEADLDPVSPDAISVIQSHPAIITTGWMQDVRPYFAISHVLAFPSYREGFPNVVLQAGAMDLPSIATDINGCNEIVEQGKNGIIIPPKDKAALFGAMKNLLEDEPFFHRLKANARQTIVSRYDQSYLWKALLSEYRRLESRETPSLTKT